MVMTEVLSMCDFEADEFDDVLYPVSTRAKDAAEAKFPLSLKKMRDDQLNDKDLKKKIERAQRSGSKAITYKEVEGVELIHETGRILVPTAAQDRILDWYHKILVHPGQKRMYQMIRNNPENCLHLSLGCSSGLM